MGYHKKNREIIIEQVELQQSVYVYKCEGCTIQVKGKCSNIVLDQCKKTGLVFDSVMVGVEMVNCQSVQVQVIGSTPTISVEDRRLPDVHKSRKSRRQHYLEQV